MTNDIMSEMETKNLTPNEEHMLEKAVEMIEEGHQLTDNEMALLTGDKAAATAYRQLTALRDVVASPRPGREESGKWKEEREEWKEERGERKEESGKWTVLSGSWTWMLAAAAILLALIVTYPLLRNDDSPAEDDTSLLVYEHTEKPGGIILRTDKGKTIDIAAPKARTQLAQLTNNEGQLVLDYQTLIDQGYNMNTEVETNTVEIPMGKDFKLVLSDGTEVWLNADSRLIYPSHFIEDERKVFLAGEAYFRVAKDSEHPFVVTTSQMDARVLGTELNVRSRNNEHGQPHVALVTGKVEVRTKDNQRCVLTPGLGATLDEGHLEVAPEDMEPYVYWRNGFVYFENATLMEVAQSVGRWFNVSVALANEQTGNIRLHFLYKRSDSLRCVVSILNSFGKFQAEVKDHTLVIQP